MSRLAEHTQGYGAAKACARSRSQWARPSGLRTAADRATANVHAVGRARAALSPSALAASDDGRTCDSVVPCEKLALRDTAASSVPLTTRTPSRSLLPVKTVAGRPSRERTACLKLLGRNRFKDAGPVLRPASPLHRPETTANTANPFAGLSTGCNPCRSPLIHRLQPVGQHACVFCEVALPRSHGATRCFVYDRPCGPFRLRHPICDSTSTAWALRAFYRLGSGFPSED